MMSDQKASVYIARNVVTTEERSALLEKAEDHFRNGEMRANPVGPHRFARRLEEEPYLDELVQNMTKRIVGAFGLHDCPLDPHLGRICSRIEPGGYIQSHTDKLCWFGDDTSSENFRCNIMVQLGNKTGLPVIEGKRAELHEGDAWGVFASRLFHGTQVISGKPRIIYGFGFVVPKDFEPTTAGL
jgi:hypothetical protein